MILLKKLLKNSMNKYPEIELRGPLRHGEEAVFYNLKNYLKIVKDKQLVVFMKELPLSLRIKSNQSLPYIEFIQKKKFKNLRSIHNEIGFRIQKKDVKDFLSILAQLGINKGFYSPVDRTDIFFSDITWSIKKGSIIGDYWEVEATDELASKLKKKTSSIKYLMRSASGLGLKFWSETEFKTHMYFSWKKVKPKPLSLLWKKYLN